LVKICQDLLQDGTPSNINLSRQHYVSSEHSWGTRKKIFLNEDEGKEKDEVDEEYRFNEMKRMGMHTSRKIAMEHDMLCSDFWQ
jgi:hypothetical protein